MGVMQAIRRLVGGRRALEAPSELWPWVARKTSSGEVVTPQTALGVSAVFACVRIIAGTLACLPLEVYERQDNGAKRRLREHPLWTLLHDQPNDEMTSLEFRDWMYQSLLLRGNAYIGVERTGAGVPASLVPLVADNMTVRRAPDGSLFYEYNVPGKSSIVFRGGDGRLMHVRAMTLNGITGESVLSFARETVGSAVAAQKYNAEFFGAHAVPRVVLINKDAPMDDESWKRFKKRWAEALEAGGTAILEGGFEIKPLGLTAKDAQWLEGMQFGVEEIARFFQVPLHMLASNARESSFGTGIEAMNIAFIQQTLTYWAKLVETAVVRDLLLPSERGRVFVEYNFDGLLRGDSVARTQALQVRRQNGIISANEWRAIENLPPIPGGDELYMPLNFAPVGSVPLQRSGNVVVEHRNEAKQIAASGAESRAKKDGPARRARIAARFRPLIKEAVHRIVRMETSDLRKAAKKHLNQRQLPDMEKFIAEFYEKFPEAIGRIIEPVIRAYAEAVAEAAGDEVEKPIEFDRRMADFVSAYVDAYAARHIDDSREKISKALSGENPLESLIEELDEWEEMRPESEAAHESVKCGSAVARIAWMLLGVQVLRWLSNPDCCPICADLNGKVAEISKSFVGIGDKLGEGDDAMNITREFSHPPAHDGCRCTIVPE